MGYQEWDDLGDKIQNIINSAINENNYQKLSNTVNQTVSRAMDSLRAQTTVPPRQQAAGAHRQAAPMGQKSASVRRPMQDPTKVLYERAGKERIAGVLLTILGALMTVFFGLNFLVFLLAFTMDGLFVGLTAAVGIVAVAGVLLLRNGCGRLGRVSRFKRYLQALGQRTYCELAKLSRIVGKPEKFVRKDVEDMIGRGWFLEGHMDEKKTCLITSDETYYQYLETKKAQEDRERLQRQQPKAVQPEVQEILDRGNDFIKKIRMSNDAIPGEEISAKISRMELLVQKIFDRAKEHPEVLPDLKRLMDYYLPMTVKLLDAYEDMDAQPVQGENIKNAKKEIEETMDTLNIAFEKLLDSIFEDTALDVSSDISVLQAVLAQEGLKDDDLAKLKKER